MKEKILQLREEGKSYSEISKELDISKSTISYHIGLGQKQKTRNRTSKLRENKIFKSCENFKKNKREALRKFQLRNGEVSFNWKDVLNKFGRNTKCYLTGESIDLLIDDYVFDHIIPVSRGGTSSLDNLGITKAITNRMKTDMLKEELIEICKKIIEYNC